ncbi:hypothetical protein CR513_51990, partial [Mucuna pruriens]
MKYPMGKEVGVIKADQRVAHQCYEESLKVRCGALNHDRTNLNLLQQPKDQRPCSIEDLKEIHIGPCRLERTKINTALDVESEE